MVRKSRPRTGSLAYYPRVKAKRQTPSFASVGHVSGDAVKPLNFVAYKAGMTHALVVNSHSKSHLFNQEEFVPVTVLEVPPLSVYGVRVYGASDRYGVRPLSEVWAAKRSKELERKISGTPSKKSSGKKSPKVQSIEALAPLKEKASHVRLLCHSVPSATGGEKKTPDVFEVFLSGSLEQQWNFAAEKLGGEIAVSDVFSEKDLCDVHAVTTGRGMQGVVKRNRVKSIGRKAKKVRNVGSIGPWHPSTVMWTVARPGQMGYHLRTEFNKSILKVGQNGEEINPSGGFPHYGNVRGAYVLLAGSVPGPVKRAVGLRVPVRPNASLRNRFGAVKHVGSIVETGKPSLEGIKSVKVKVEAEKKAERKSVDDEIRSAITGEKK